MLPGVWWAAKLIYREVYGYDKTAKTIVIYKLMWD